MNRTLRLADPADFPVITKIDAEVVVTSVDRSGLISIAIEQSRCFIVTSDSQIEGYAIASPKAFQGMDFLDLVVVDPSIRNQGVATLLITHFRESANSPECWTSTNQSNQAMLSLLRKLGWHESDHVEELDLGDPELFFFIK